MLSLNGLMFPFFGKSSGDMASMKEKFKNLKQCQMSFQEGFEHYFDARKYSIFEYTDWEYLSCKEYAAELAKDLDETFADRSTEFKVLIMSNTEEEKGFQIIKMPFKNSVITRLE